MKVPVYSLDGKQKKEIELPIQFNEVYRSDLIKRAVLSEESKMRQPKGAFKRAGMETSAKYKGRKEDYGSLKNQGQAMLPREIKPEGEAGKVRRIPSSVKGRRAHPPKVEKKIVELINKKEYAKAMRSALGSTLIGELVKERCGVEMKTLPLVIVNDFEKLTKAKEALIVLEALGIKGLVKKAKSRTSKKTGVARRGKKQKRTPKYILIIVNEHSKAASNLPGLDVVKVSELKVKDFAPGTKAGRVTVFTESALEEIKKMR